LAHEVDALRGARAGGVEEIAVARDLVRPCESCARTLVEVAPRVVGEKRGFVPASRQAALLETEQEHDLEAARARAQKIKHRDTSRLRGGCSAYLRAFERGDNFLGRDGTVELAPAAQLGDQAHDGVVHTDVVPRRPADWWRLEPVSGAQHRAG